MRYRISYSGLKIAQDWHDGQWSDLYSLQCTGIVRSRSHRNGLLSEIRSSYLNSKGKISERERRRLKRLYSAILATFRKKS